MKVALEWAQYNNNRVHFILAAWQLIQALHLSLALEVLS